ncbi:hypothetical protein [Aureimonas ureilytica]|nr:hypothetical protein [Aureimonas ureilytica]
MSARLEFEGISCPCVSKTAFCPSIGSRDIVATTTRLLALSEFRQENIAMPMTRLEFEKSFFNPENKIVRRAFILEALAKGPKWREWAKAGRTQTVPAIYNDLVFAACYGFFRNSPTRNRIAQMRDFLWCRSATDCGFLVNPFHQASDARKQVGQTAVSVTQDFAKAEAAAQIPGSVEKVKIPDSAATNIYASIYSEMWLPNGSMKAFIASADQGAAIANIGPNVATLASDEGMSLWLTSLAKRFAGTTSGAARYGETFNTDYLGLTGPDAAGTVGRIGTRRVAIGAHR